MSRANKVNKDRYTQRGRLTPDELARGRAREFYVSDTRRKFNAAKPERARRAAPASTRDRTARGEEE